MRTRRKKREEFIREVGRARSQGEICEVIRKQRGGRKRVNEEIKEKEWRKYFMDLMGRSENKVKGGERRIEETTGNELERGEVEAVLRNLKRGKVAGEDGLVNEVWRYEGEEVKKGIWEICGIWKREGWPDDWNTGIVVPIVKKGEGRKVEEYRRVTLLWIRPIRFMWEFWKGDLEWRWRRKGWCRKTRRGSGGTWGGDDGEHICDKISNEQGIGKEGRENVGLFSGHQDGIRLVT